MALSSAMQLLLILLNLPQKAFFLPVYAFSSLLFPLGSFSEFPSLCQNDHLITDVVPITPIMVISLYYFFFITPWDMLGNLCSLTRDQSCTPALEAHGFKHWTPRKVPVTSDSWPDSPCVGTAWESGSEACSISLE